MFKIKRGLTLPITGDPKQSISEGPSIRTVAVLGGDYIGMKPTMSVQIGDEVKLGQVLFEDKKNPGVKYTAPAAGTVAAINRGAKRVLQSVVIDIKKSAGEMTFPNYGESDLATLGQDTIEKHLIDSGLWTSLRTRPFSKVPAPKSRPDAIFVTAMDTNPLAADPNVVLNEMAGWAELFGHGLTIIKQLTQGKTYVCHAPNSKIPQASGADYQIFDGPHPAGLVGTHIHNLMPVGPNRTVWSINYQDVVAIGALFTTGKILTDRVVAVAGPQVADPRLIKTRVGASTDEITAGGLKEGENRVISGSVLSGTHAFGPYSYLGRYHTQVSVIAEGRQRFMFDFFRLGFEKFSVMHTYISKLNPAKRFNFTSSANGGARGMVPIGAYERVMPLDILPTQLLRALIVGDTESAQQLGCLELDEEDLALCTFVCPCKYEYGPILRDNLTSIEREG